MSRCLVAGSDCPHDLSKEQLLCPVFSDMIVTYFILNQYIVSFDRDFDRVEWLTRVDTPDAMAAAFAEVGLHRTDG